jgi:hypothetical protein
MATRIKKNVFDFLVKEYKTKSRQVEILPKTTNLSNVKALPDYKDNFLERWYLSIQGEDNPTFSNTVSSPKNAEEQHVYRYDWTFGITVVKNYWWDWQEELPDDNSLAIHAVLVPIGIGDAPEAIPISATLSAMHPSRNTKSMWELTWPKMPKAAAEMAKIGSLGIPQLSYVSTALMTTSNILDSYTENKKNWYIYQFLDEKLECPTIEWRISKRVLAEYGPLVRGTLFVVFHGSSESTTGGVRILLRPQIRYYPQSDLDYIIPTDMLDEDQQVFVDVKPKDWKETKKSSIDEGQ